MHHNSHTTGHPVNLDYLTILDRRSQGVTRTTKVAMYIWVNDPSLKRNLEKYQLPHIWDEVLLDTLSLQLKQLNSTPSSMGNPHITQYAGGMHNLNLVGMVPCGVSFPPPQHSPIPHLSGTMFGK